MPIGAIHKPKMNFEDYLKNIGKSDEVKQNNNVTNPHNSFSSAVQFAKKTDIFTAAKMYGNEQTTQKENSGSNAASTNSGNIVARFTNLISSNTENNIPDTNNNIGNLSAAASGHTPQGINPVTPNALRETSGNEAINPEQNKLSKETQNKVDHYYQQFLEATNKIENKAENGIEETTGQATLSTGDNNAIGDKTDKIGDGHKPADNSNGVSNTTKSETKPGSEIPKNIKTPDKKDSSNADNPKNVDKQQEIQQQKDIENKKLKEAEEVNKRKEQD